MISRIVPPGDRVSHGITIDQPSTTRGKKKVGWPFATPLSAVIFLRLSRKTGEEKKEGGPDKSMNSPFLFSNASWNNYRFICPSVGSIVVSPLLSLFSKTRVGKRWLCEEI